MSAAAELDIASSPPAPFDPHDSHDKEPDARQAELIAEEAVRALHPGEVEPGTEVAVLQVNLVHDMTELEAANGELHHAVSPTSDDASDDSESTSDFESADGGDDPTLEGDEGEIVPSDFDIKLALERGGMQPRGGNNPPAATPRNKVDQMAHKPPVETKPVKEKARDQKTLKKEEDAKNKKRKEEEKEKAKGK